ncbi:MAG TPA: single-stranded-DNA-specific exonuclease RecJ, partial [Candidatus Binatia bacterium]
MPPPSRKRWLLREADPLAVVRQSEQLKVSPLLARMLILRGYLDSQSAKRYLSSSLREDLPSPFEMIDMEPAVARLVRAIEDKEQIGIWGDYDVDGTTGA